MSNGDTQPAQPIPTGMEILRTGIDNLRATNERANNELTATLAQMRENLQLPYASPVLPTAPDDVQYQRLLLHNSQWVSEVVMAAVLNDEFKQQTGDRAREILVEQGMFPELGEQPSDSTPPG